MKTEILANRTKFLGALFLSVTLTLFGVMLAFFPEYFGWFPLGDHNKLIIGLTIALIFAVVFVFALIKLKEDKVAVTVDDNGITDHIGGMSLGTISWDDILHFSEDSQVGNKFVVIHVKDPQAIMDAQSKLMRALLQQQTNSFGSPIAIGGAMLQGGYQRLREVLASEGAKRDVHFK